MKFTATDEQLRQLCANAVNASRPAGMGFLHYQSRAYTPDEFQINDRSPIVSLDYVEGRMTKLHISRDETGALELREPIDDLQSWAVKYPTALALLSSVPGIVTAQGAQAKSIAQVAPHAS